MGGKPARLSQGTGNTPVRSCLISRDVAAEGAEYPPFPGRATHTSLNSSIQREVLGVGESRASRALMLLHERSLQSLSEISDHQQNWFGLPAFGKVGLDLDPESAGGEGAAFLEQGASLEVPIGDCDWVIDGDQHVIGEDAKFQLRCRGQIALAGHTQGTYVPALDAQLKPWYDTAHWVRNILRNLQSLGHSAPAALSPCPDRESREEKKEHGDQAYALKREVFTGGSYRLGRELREVNIPEDRPASVGLPLVNPGRGIKRAAAAAALTARSLLNKTAGRTRHRVSTWGGVAGHDDWNNSLFPAPAGPRRAHFTYCLDARQRGLAVRAPSPAGRLARNGAGFTLIETLVALTLLAFTLLGLAMLFPLVVRMASLSSTTSETSRLAQKELDQIRQNISATSGSFTDLDGNTVEVACTGTPGTSCGNPLTALGGIDFSQPPAVGFSGQLADPSGQLYSVRWNISVTASGGRKIILAGEPLNSTSGLAPIVQFQTLTAQ
jgi:type II secretory pathway pseudopilin PulG